MLFSSNRFHNTYFGMMAGEVSGDINRRANNVEEYFALRKENKKLRDQNAFLLSNLPSGQLMPDTGYKYVADTAYVDSVKQFLQYQYLSAKVISNSVFLQQNYLTLHRGSEQGVSENMAVVGTDGIIGTVVGVSKNMSLVMSLLHKQSKVIAILKKGSGLGEITWDGKDPGLLVLRKIPKTVVVKKGDEVVSSPYSDKFPPGSRIGWVDNVQQDLETNTYILKVRTAVDFSNVQHAYVVKNALREEMNEVQLKQIKE
jgi:rod shape-determining protein MreC